MRTILWIKIWSWGKKTNASVPEKQKINCVGLSDCVFQTDSHYRGEWISNGLQWKTIGPRNLLCLKLPSKQTLQANLHQHEINHFPWADTHASFKWLINNWFCCMIQEYKNEMCCFFPFFFFFRKQIF